MPHPFCQACSHGTPAESPGDPHPQPAFVALAVAQPVRGARDESPRGQSKGHSVEHVVRNRASAGARPAAEGVGEKVRTFGAAWGFFRYLAYMRMKLHLYRTGILNQP